MLRLILVHRYKAPKFSCVFWSSQMVAIYKVRNLFFYWFDSSFIFAVEELHNFYLIINVYLGCTGVSAQCVKIIHIRSFFWSVLSRSRDEYGIYFADLCIQPEHVKVRTRKHSAFDTFKQCSLLSLPLF